MFLPLIRDIEGLPGFAYHNRILALIEPFSIDQWLCDSMPFWRVPTAVAAKIHFHSINVNLQQL